MLLHTKRLNLIAVTHGAVLLYSLLAENVILISLNIFKINLKCDILKADSNEKTAFIVACEEGNVRIAKILIQSGSAVNHCDKEKKIIVTRSIVL